MGDERTPVVVGVGQLVQHDLDLREALVVALAFPTIGYGSPSHCTVNE